MKRVDIDPFLAQVSKPSRYIDHEINAIRKSWSEVNICFAFPDAYEVGISHLGLKILYSIVNKLDNATADRTYLPWIDMLKVMRDNEVQLFAWESRIPVRDFDIIGITLQSELTFSNVLELLDLSRIPVRSIDRKSDDPIVLAGGPCASNPLPLSPFIDVFFIGEAEEAIREIAGICKEFRSRNDRLLALSNLSGCYVPMIHTNLSEVRIKIRKHSDFGAMQDIHSPQILPWQLATHNRYVAEIMRGCTRGCRFCHAGYFYRPIRERSPEDILDMILEEIKTSGWDEAGLVSLSSSDYSCIRPLLKAILNRVDTNKTHISLPSLRVDTIDDELIGLMQSLGREGLTIAPEAGSQRLRNVINKNLSEAEIMDGVNTAIRLGWQKIKLYFMLGLPFETEDDIDAIIELITKIDQVSNRKLQINVTLSPFVPKPFTPFQWVGMASRETLLSRSIRIKQHFSRRKYIKIKYHTIENSILEALLTRADLSFSDTLYQAWKGGAVFDAWNECFDFGIWQKAIEDTGIDTAILLGARQPDHPLPWSHIDIGVTEEFLLREYENAKQEVITEDCRFHCTNCGVCDASNRMMILSDSAIERQSDDNPKERIPNNSQHKDHRYRLFYRKVGILRFISHLDWMRMLFRLISMLKLDVVYTQGFNPHPKVSLSPPLPLGVLGLAEFFDLSVREPIDEAQLINCFKAFGIPDFDVYTAMPIEICQAIPSSEIIEIGSDLPWENDMEALISKFKSSPSLIFTKEKKGIQKNYDVKAIIQDIQYHDGRITIQKSLNSPSLYDLLEFILGIDKSLLYNKHVQRSRFIA